MYPFLSEPPFLWTRIHFRKCSKNVFTVRKNLNLAPSAPRKPYRAKRPSRIIDYCHRNVKFVHRNLCKAFICLHHVDWCRCCPVAMATKVLKISITPRLTQSRNARVVRLSRAASFEAVPYMYMAVGDAGATGLWLLSCLLVKG